MLLVAGIAGPSWAQGLDFKLTNRLTAGQKPSIAVKAGGEVTSLALTVNRDDGAQFTAGSGPVRAGQSVVLTFGDGKGGVAKWTGKLVARWKSGKQESFDLSFDTQTVGELKVGYALNHLDLEGHKLEITMTRPAGRAAVVVFGEDGRELGKGEATFAGEAPGTWLPIAWTQAPGNVLRIEVRATSKDELTTLLKLMPWSVKVPHEEVNFESGKSEIRATETPKLDASYQKIVDAIAVARRADPALPVRLYVAGHTDRVGSATDNRKLSIDRARAIASWFRERGLPLPVAFAGFGEETPLVETPDEKDEPRNRRVDYIVGLEEPLIGKQRKKGSWALTR